MSDKKKDPKKLGEGQNNPQMVIDVRDYSNDPLAVKKVESAQQLNLFIKY